MASALQNAFTRTLENISNTSSIKKILSHGSLYLGIFVYTAIDAKVKSHIFIFQQTIVDIESPKYPNFSEILLIAKQSITDGVNKFLNKYRHLQLNTFKIPHFTLAHTSQIEILTFF